jgi:hypothetical protein
MTVTLATRPGQVLSQFLTLDNLAYLRDLLSPVAFLSLLAPQVLVMALPTLLVNFLSTDGFMHQLEGFHYGAVLAPVTVVAAAYGAGWLLRRFRQDRALPMVLSAVILVSTFLYHRGHGYTPLSLHYGGTWPAVTDHHLAGEEMAGQIPAEASLAALPYLNPHASQRQKLYMIDRLQDGVPAPVHGADLIWLDVTNSWPLHPNDLRTGVESLLAGDYGVEGATDGWLLLGRGAAERELPDGFFDFARAPAPQPEYPMRLQFLLNGVPVLEVLGFDVDLVHSRSDPETPTSALHFYWRALEALPSDLRLYPFYFDDESGEVLEDTSQRPMVTTVWYPPDRWKVGEVVKTSTFPWAVGPEFGVGLGVYQGDDWSDASFRLPIRVESSEHIIRLFQEDTWARLLRIEDAEPVPERRLFSAPTPAYRLDADLDGKVRLVGYDLKRIADDRLQVTLYWQALQALDTSYTVFVQVLGPAGEVRSQVDAVPQAGGYPTNWWLPGEIVADPIVMEVGAEGSSEIDLHLIAGMYEPVTGARLPVLGTSWDYVELGAVRP